jgi:hypothetical protein
MTPIEIVQLALSLGALVVAVTVGLTGAFKKFFPNTEPLAFSIPAGAAVTVLAWFATQPIPVNVNGWTAFALVVIIGALLPSGLFDAGVNMLRKGGLGGVMNFSLTADGDCGCEGEAQ